MDQLTPENTQLPFDRNELQDIIKSPDRLMAFYTENKQTIDAPNFADASIYTWQFYVPPDYVEQWDTLSFEWKTSFWLTGLHLANNLKGFI